MIYHLTTPRIWEQQHTKDAYDLPSRQTEGFIHCSTEKQLLESAKSHFSAEAEVVVLCIVEESVEEMLKYELSRGGELFPHLYGAIPISAVRSTKRLTKNEKGEFEWI